MIQEDSKEDIMVQMRLRPVILLYGDSITQFSFGEPPAVKVGWASLLSSAYQRRADVLSRGFSGYNTQHALELCPRVFGSREEGFLFCTVFFGANDAAMPGERQHVPIEEYGDNLGKIIASIRKRTGTSQNDQTSTTASFPIIIMTPPPIENEVWKKELATITGQANDHYDRTNDAARKYGEEAKKIASQFDCLVLDTWQLLGGDTADYAKHMSDGLHLSDSGNQLVYEGLMNLVKKDYPHLAPQELVDGEYQGIGIPVEEKLWGDLC
jgi:lysophospholipase L1-like esterase